MSGRGRLTVCAALASLLTALSLLPLASPSGWYVQALLVVVVQSAVGAAARRIPLARPLTVAAQALVTLLLFTFAFARGQALLGIVPGPDAVARLGQLVSDGAQDVGQYAIPAPVTPGIRLMLVGGVVLVALIVDALAVTYRSAAPAGLPLLALYSVASGLEQGGARWLWFLLAAAGYLALLLAEGRDRLSRWGRVFGGPRRASGAPAADAWEPALAPARTGRRIGAMALGIALIAPVALPAMGGGLLGAGGTGGLGHGDTISAVNPLVSLQDSLNQPSDAEVLRYRTTDPDAGDMYLRILTLDQFDGTTWKASERRVGDVPDTLPTPQGLSSSVRTTPVSTSIAAAPGYAQNYLPLPYPATRVRVNGEWRYEPEGRTLVGDQGQTTSGVQYQVASLEVEPTAQQLADAPPPPASLEREYTQVPSDLPPVVKQTAQQVTRGATNAYERAVKLQDWFTITGGFTYDTRVAEGSGPDAIARFLRDKKGFCVHFAFAMAAMARTLGIPARVDVGFVPGTLQSDSTWSVGLKDAHAWPELYFQGVGWTRFEPTPSRGSAPDYTRGPTPSGSGGDVPAPHLGDTSAPTVTASAPAGCGHTQRRLGGCGNGSQLPLGPPSGGDGPGGGTIAVLVLVGLALLLGLLPMAWRSRVRGQRLGGTRAAGAALVADDPTDDAAAPRTLAAWRELVDTAWDYGVPPDESETPRRAAARLITTARLAGTGAAGAVERVAGAVEQVLYAPRPQPTSGLADDVRLVRRALHDAADRPVRLRARFAPRSAVRVLWRLTERWNAVTARWREARPRVADALRRRTTGDRTA
ncbi:DUF3488 and transglutaminase-like domain-containing protein [Streptomyces sp. PTM05]|uniref:DUF3488 and transglutaminase-like domain-containing protein n=1 Tax=Streptantibioticus parmotrematis TaxID=2873249 RepID=A0ABS7QSL8_9ACTN|nr:DUF3488 and transglutaminase-like domain-containing protein [Streptantibioticus parmotrematis]MBY8886179.1 DUF3488 and transglutaminase-like domain-containing protein [Streptantibioticus parmotrematis]